MIAKRTVEAWVEGYLRAWKSNDPQEIAQLFTEDAAYFTGPFAEPWQGRQAIVQNWLARKDEPGSWSFRYEVLATGEDLGVVRGWTRYLKPEREFSNIWMVRLDETGRAEEFTEWWVDRQNET
jgi:uncharacterized protein (TIGR02246 family)